MKRDEAAKLVFESAIRIHAGAMSNPGIAMNLANSYQMQEMAKASVEAASYIASQTLRVED